MEDTVVVAGESQIWSIISHASTNTELWMLIGGPTLLTISFALILWLFVQRKLRRERKSDHDFFNQSATTSPSQVDHIPEVQATAPVTWSKSLWDGLSKTRSQLAQSLGQLFTGSSLSDDSFEKIHETLFRCDMGVDATDRLVDRLKKEFRGKADAPWSDVKSVLQNEIRDLINPTQNAETDLSHQPTVILVAGVNGVGKTTTIAKLASRYQKEAHKTVVLCAADTFRAAAIDQLKVWGDRVGCEVIAHQEGSDPAAVVFDAVKATKSRQADVLIIDTAGRLHNKKDLMDELSKINRVIKKEIPQAPHEVWLVIDATTGQNAVQQAKVFKECVNVTGIIATKLDGTAKGGVLVAIASLLQIPIRYLGIGESMDDLKSFDAEEFSKALFD